MADKARVNAGTAGKDAERAPVEIRGELQPRQRAAQSRETDQFTQLPGTLTVCRPAHPTSWLNVLVVDWQIKRKLIDFSVIFQQSLHFLFPMSDFQIENLKFSHKQEVNSIKLKFTLSQGELENEKNNLQGQTEGKNKVYIFLFCRKKCVHW